MIIILDTVDSVLTLANLSVEVQDYLNGDHGVAACRGWMESTGSWFLSMLTRTKRLDQHEGHCFGQNMEEDLTESGFEIYFCKI